VSSHGSCYLGAVNLWTESLKNETVKPSLQTVLHDFLGKDCMASSMLLYFFYFLWSLPTPGHQEERIKILLGLGAVPLEGHIHVNVSLLFVLHLLFTFTREKIIQTTRSTCYGNSKFNHFFSIPCLQHVLVRLDFHVISGEKITTCVETFIKETYALACLCLY
jgi:hypothetical protein